MLSETLYIGVSPGGFNPAGDVVITRVNGPVFLGPGTASVDLLQAQVEGTAFRAWVEIMPPGFVPGSGDGQLIIDLDQHVGMELTTGHWDWEWTGLGGFIDPGTYRVLYFAEDDEGNVSSMESAVYKEKDGNQKPDPFSVLIPAENEEINRFPMILDWEEATDPDGDAVTYTLFLSEDPADFVDPVITKTGLWYSVCTIGKTEGLKSGTTYHWKVRAIDEYGAYTDSNPETFSTDITNDTDTRFDCYLYEKGTDQPVSNAEVRLDTVSLVPGGSGYYTVMSPSGLRLLSVEAPGYADLDNIVVDVPVSSSESGFRKYYYLDPDNTPPAADPQSVSTGMNQPINITLTGSDVDGDSLTYEIVTQPEHGSLSGSGPDRVYTPGEGYTGPDGFTFRVNDGKVDSAPATVSIEVSPTPVPRVDIRANGEDGPVTLSNGETVSVTISLFPEHYAGILTDWWVAVSTPGSDWYTYVHPDQWLPGIYRCALVELFELPLPGFPVMKDMVLPLGSYTFYFLVDSPDGQPNVEGPNLMDTVVVNVE